MSVPKKSPTRAKAEDAPTTAPSSASPNSPVGLPRYLQGPHSTRHQMATQGISDGGEPLPYRETIQRAFGLTHDLTNVRAHIGGQAQKASTRLNAQAYTTGEDVAFASSPDLGLVAHEAAHVVQQRNGVLSGGIGQSGDTYERQADAVAAGVGLGASVANLLPLASSQSSGTPALQCKEDTAASNQTSTATPTDAILSILYLKDPQTGDSDYHAAILVLDRLQMPELLSTLDDLARLNRLTELFPHIGGPFDYDQGRLVSAMRIVRLKHPELGMLSGWEAKVMGWETAQLAPEEQQAIEDYLTNGLGYRDFLRMAREGASVLGADPSEATSSTADDTDQSSEEDTGSSSSLPAAQNMSVAMGASAPVFGPGFWRSGKQPPGYYIGMTAHLAIPLFYEAAHPGDTIYTNFFDVGRIIKDFAATELPDTPSFPLTAAQLKGEPDIANITLRHLYEIKPAGEESLAFQEAEEYCEALTLAGIPIWPGPMWEAGTFGFFYDAGWYFTFDSPMPGVIVYRRQQKSPLDTEPAEEPVGQTAPQEMTEGVAELTASAKAVQATVAASKTLEATATAAEAAEDTTASEGLVVRFFMALEAAE